LHYKIESWFWNALDWIFPPRCCGCDKIGERICQSCLSRVQKVIPPYCQICGKSLSVAGICRRCILDPPGITALRSWVIFGEIIRKAIHQLKYYRNITLGDTFSQFLVYVLVMTDWEVDIITPVPLGVVRLRERGYNQSALLARPIAMRLGIPYNPKIVSRTRETKSQTELTYPERRINVLGAFHSDPQVVEGKKILIVDDVTTSGSTLTSCADALFRAGANNVYGLTLARVSYEERVQIY